MIGSSNIESQALVIMINKIKLKRKSMLYIMYNHSSGIFYDRKRISNKSLIPLGPLPLSVNNLLKFNPQKYKMNLESKIRHRNEGM